MPTPTWFALFTVGATAGLGLMLATWLIRTEIRERRKARFLRSLRPQHPKKQPTTADTSSRTVTVNDLVGRIRSEGRPVRLNRDDE